MTEPAFNPEMLSLARDLRSITQTELHQMTGIPQPTISKIEGGMLSPSDEDLEKISDALLLPGSFFCQPDAMQGLGLTLYYRKRRATTQKKIDWIQSVANLLRIWTAHLIRSAMPPDCKIPQLNICDYGRSPRRVANAVRAQLGLPTGPIRNLVRTIEDAGGIVLLFDFGTTKMDAVGFWPPGLPPMFLLNSAVPPERARFSLAHELGHVVMHRTLDQDNETEADRFAGEFLMPRSEINADLFDIDFSKLSALKTHWKVSMKALIYRAHQLGHISDARYRKFNTIYSSRGYNSGEPNELPREYPSLLLEMIKIHIEQLGYSYAELAQLLCLSPREFRTIFFNTPENEIHMIRTTGIFPPLNIQFNAA